MHHDDLAQVAATGRLADAIETACSRIAPNWPLDQSIAVNPFWGWVQQPVHTASAHLGLLAGTRIAAPLAHARAAWREGRLQRDHLTAACVAAGIADTAGQCARLARVLDADTPDSAPAACPTLAALAPQGPVHDAQPARDAVVHQISQHCAAWFDEDQGSWHPDRSAGLWQGWRQSLAADRGLRWRRGQAWLRAQLHGWPDAPHAAVAHGLEQLGMPEAGWTDYLSALLLSVNGWAAWCAWRRWQARLNGGADDTLVELLAMRLAWDVLLAQDQDLLGGRPGWAARWARLPTEAQANAAGQADAWLLQHALELAWQQPLARALAESSTRPLPAADVQAVFCIDVRSEVYRRALESVDPRVHTRGFAGFFGLPIAYAPVGSALVRPQLPGLLAPALQASDDGVPLATALAARRRSLGLRAAWERWRGHPGSGFSCVETTGLAAAGQLLARSLPGTRRPARWEDTGLPVGTQATPRLPSAVVGSQDGVTFAAGILRAMGLREDFAPLVLLAGHGSTSANNAHAAGLDCGACGGQTGEVNARALAALLNDPQVRAGLVAHGIAIPAGTHFLPALHDTTTDDVHLHDLAAVPAAHGQQVERLRLWLAQASQRARAERAPGLSAPAGLAADGLAGWFRRRSNDWSQVRPEWALANNACFIVAPRARTRDLRLGGRSFLHDYDWRQDADLSVLTLVMTAPMVVTHWINMQYHASTVDNARWGSGNKLLHNVVGGRIGVFEGNGGDLRIGLPLQSLHDGERWRHEPLRLSVFIEAPPAAIDAVIAQHEVVRQLVANGWLHLLCIAPQDGRVLRWTAQGWQVAAEAQQAAPETTTPTAVGA
jgi:uncharacterized protein YbcC (UPF0753/DUF2309 family)